jgi:hypothetical protein
VQEAKAAFVAWLSLMADVEEGHKSATLAHPGNISYRLGRAVRFDATKECFEDEEANRFLKREYRAPYVVPEDI